MMNRSIFITGSSSGLGKAAAIYFAENGWNVAASMRNPEKEEELGRFENIKLIKLDVTKPDEIKTAIQEAIRIFGKIDVVLNNAGVGIYGALELIDEVNIDNSYAINVRGVINVIRGFLPHFRNNGKGMFINVGSVMGRSTAMPLGSLYNMSKFALEGLTEGLYFELKPLNIELRLIEPGGFHSEFGSKIILPESDKLTGYSGLTKTVKERLNKAVSDPDTKALDNIVKTIYHTATGRRTKFRTAVGKDAKALLFIRKILPIGMFLNFLTKLFKPQPDGPKISN
ncbi:MAG TPA: SDR family oxidoreductase [Pedobacter sp.]